MRLLLLGLFFSCLKAHAATPQFRSDFLLGTSFQENDINAANPNNRALYLPSQTYESELKPSLKLRSYKMGLQIVLRPLLRFRRITYDFGPEQQSNYYFDYGFWEGYAAWDPVKDLTLSAGIINAQWGPSDILSPSQFLFSELMIRPEPFQDTRGVEVAMAQWTPQQNLTLTAMAELQPSSLERIETPPERERHSKRRMIVRGEMATPSGSFTAGLVGGMVNVDRKRALAGSYSMWNYTDSTQIYYDVGLQHGARAYEIDPAGALVPHPSRDKSVYKVGLIGHRLTFSNGIEWKVEFIQNDFGPELSQRKRAFALLNTQPFFAPYSATLYDTGSALPGRQFIYNSLRWDNPRFLERFFTESHVFLRDIYSLSDNSHLLNLGVETSLSDRFSHSVAFIYSIGDNQSELGSLLRSYASYFIKLSF